MRTEIIPPEEKMDKAPSDLTFRGLRIFVAVEETGSIVAAARRIGASPSGISQQISALEQAVGTKLFDRTSRPVTLTPSGQVLRAHAHRILEAQSDAQAELAELNLASLPRLSLGIIDDLDATITPMLVARLQRKFKNCFVNVISGRSDMMTGKLERREAGIIVSSILPEDAGSFCSVPIARESFILVAAKGVLDRDQPIRDQLFPLPYVQFSESMPIGRLITQHLKRARFQVPQHFSFEASRSVFAMVAQTGGWAITTPFNLLDAERFLPEIEVFRLPFPAFSRMIYLVARSDELGQMPDNLAKDCRRLLEQQVLPRFGGIAPHLRNAIEIAE